MGNKTNVVITMDRKNLAKVIAVIAALLCFIGLFGTIMTHSVITNTSGSRTTQLARTFDLQYIFSDAWNLIKYMPGNAGAMKFALVLMIISFFVGIGGFAYAVGYIIYSLYKRKEIKFNFILTILLTTSIQYLFMSRFACGYNGDFYSDTYKTYSYLTRSSYVMGWGGILITIGFFLGLISSFIYDFQNKEAVINKKSICRRIAIIAIFFIGLYGLTNLSKISITSTYDSGRILIDGNYLNSFWMVVEANGDNVKVLGIFAIIFGIISYLALAGTLFFFAKGGDSTIDKRATLINSITFTASSLVANIFMIVAGHFLTENIPTNDTLNVQHVDPGFTFIVSIILGVALIVLAIIAYREKKYSKAK